jgi:Citrate synthase
MISDPNIKIGRPRQLFTGKKHREYLPIENRYLIKFKLTLY